MVVIAGLFFTVPGFGQMRIKVHDLLQSPDKYYWQEILLSGKVVDIKRSEGLFMGSYTLKCNFGDTIDILSKNLPPMGYKFTVKVTVKPGRVQDSLIVEEIERKSTGTTIGLIVFSVVFTLMGIMLVLGYKNKVDIR